MFEHSFRNIKSQYMSYFISLLQKSPVPVYALCRMMNQNGLIRGLLLAGCIALTVLLTLHLRPHVINYMVTPTGSLGDVNKMAANKGEKTSMYTGMVFRLLVKSPLSHLLQEWWLPLF